MGAWAQPDGAIGWLGEWGWRHYLRVEVAGRVPSENRARRTFTLPGGHRKATVLTLEAEAWIEAVTYATRGVVNGRPESLPHPREWPRPLHVLAVTLGRVDADNPLKLTLDGLKLGLGVDDRHFDHTALRRSAAGRREGMILVVMGARLDALAGIAPEIWQGGTLWPIVSAARARGPRTTKPAARAAG